MTAKDWLDLVQIVLALGAAVFVLGKGWQSWLDHEYKKRELQYREVVDVSNNELELAKENTLRASQVADILQSYKEVIGDLEEMKAGLRDTRKNSDEKVANLVSLINKIEHMVETQTQNFTEFLMGKLKYNGD